MNVFIYSLSDPVTGKIRYVGKTTNAASRLRSHRNDRQHTHKGCWVRSLRAAGLWPCPEHRDKIRLGNTGKNMSAESIARTAAAHLGRRNTPEVIEKMKRLARARAEAKRLCQSQ